MALMLDDTATLFSGTNLLIGIFGFLVIIGSAILVLMSRKSESDRKNVIDRADASDKLLSVRDTELSDSKKKCDKCHEELEDVVAEHRALSAITLKDLFAYWATREDELAKMQNLESKNRVLRKRLGDE